MLEIRLEKQSGGLARGGTCHVSGEADVNSRLFSRSFFFFFLNIGCFQGVSFLLGCTYAGEHLYFNVFKRT